MHRFTLAGMFLFACLSYAQSAGSIRGTVTFQAGQTVAHDATVHLEPLGRTVRTGSEGNYEFTNVPPGRYELVTHLHYFNDERKIVSVTAGETVEANFRLRIAATRQEVTVTASGHQENVLETFQTVTSLSGQELSTRAAASSLGELLDHETGIAKRSFGPGTSRPVIRGFDGDRVLVLSDGSRTGTLSSQSGDHGEPVDPSQLERVEVVRGPATLLYGSSAIGGVVNIISRHHELDEHPHAGVRGNLTGLGGTTNGFGGGSGAFEVGVGQHLIWASGGSQRTGDYSTPLGKVENSGSYITQTGVGAARYGERAFWGISYNLQDGRYGIPFGPETEEHDEAEEEEHHHDHGAVKIDWRRHNIRLNGGFRSLPGFIESARAYANLSDWKHKELEGAEVGTRFHNRQWTFNGVAQQRRTGRLSGSFGAWGMHRSFDSVGEEALAPPVEQNAAALFTMQEVGFERFRVQFGGRIEHNGYSADGARSRSFTGFSGAAGIHVPLTHGAAAVFNYTSSYRAPALEELYNNGPHLGNLIFEIGNPDLRRERGNGYELSFRQSSSRTRMEVTVFRNDMKDFVYLAPTGRIEDGLFEADYAQADARYLGAEARVDLAIRPGLWVNLGFDAVDAQLKDTRTPLPRIPPVRGRVGLDWLHGGFNIRPELVLANRQWQVFPIETQTAGYAVVNVVANYTIATQHVAHMFGVNVFNAADRLYRNHLSFIKEIAPEIGRGVRLSYTVNWF
ncbi:MAG TPA: TonB-dependent receptor [Bryobacteraceae bacterium]|nr:TonB-dependent receptor [Bryobacteraceae bacterium]